MSCTAKKAYLTKKHHIQNHLQIARKKRRKFQFQGTLSCSCSHLLQTSHPTNPYRGQRVMTRESCHFLVGSRCYEHTNGCMHSSHCPEDAQLETHMPKMPVSFFRLSYHQLLCEKKQLNSNSCSCGHKSEIGIRSSHVV